MTFKLKKMGKAKLRDIERRVVADSISPNPLSDIYEAVAQAARLDGARQVVRWGDGRCPHTDPLLTYYERRTCGECWKSLLKELEVPG